MPFAFTCHFALMNTPPAELPVLNQNQGPIAEAAARRAEAAARFIALQAKVITEIDRAVAAYQVTQNNLSTLEFLAAAQERQNETVAAQVRAGAADPMDLLSSQLELGASKLAQLDGRVRFQQAFAALEDAVQRPINSVQPPVFEQSPRPQAMKGNQP